MKKQKQNNRSLPSVARSAITLLLLITAIFSGNKTNAQVLDTINFPINILQ